jgi:DNA replication protein DnaD
LKAQEDKVIYEKSVESNRNIIPSGFIRNFSDTVRGSSQLAYNIDEKLDNVMKEIGNKINSFATRINTNMNELKTDIEKFFSQQLVNKNIKLCYFFIDLIETMNPKCEKPSEKVLHTISNRFNSHQLDNISSNAFKEYINKLWK